MTDDTSQQPEERPARGFDLRERRLLADLETSGRLGTPVEARAMPFTVAPEELSRAIVNGPPRYATRRRRIEATLDRLLLATRAAWHEQANRYRDRPDRFAAGWRAWVDDVDVATVNRLIDANNRFYPIEARLRTDIRTGAYITFDGQDYRYPLVTPEWLLARFPADLGSALASLDGDVPDVSR